MTQTQFDFDAVIVNSTVVNPIERSRLSAQHAKIVDRLREGPATNRELCDIALNYRGRICELRKAGIAIDVVRNRETGLSIYSLSPTLGLPVTEVVQ